MFQKAIADLRGETVHAGDGCLGAVDDLYFDAQAWRVRYLVVSDAEEGRDLLLSVACIDADAGNGVSLSRAQLRQGSGLWPLEAAREWLDTRVCSGRRLVGCLVHTRSATAGRVVDFLVDDQGWFIDYLIVRTGPSGPGGELLVPADVVTHVDVEGGYVRVACTAQQLREFPRL